MTDHEKQVLHGIMEVVRGCSQEADADGLCECARFIHNHVRIEQEQRTSIIQAAVQLERKACAGVAKYHARHEMERAQECEKAGLQRLAANHTHGATVAETIAWAITEGGAFADEMNAVLPPAREEERGTPPTDHDRLREREETP